MAFTATRLRPDRSQSNASCNLPDYFEPRYVDLGGWPMTGSPPRENGVESTRFGTVGSGRYGALTRVASSDDGAVAKRAHLVALVRCTGRGVLVGFAATSWAASEVHAAPTTERVSISTSGGQARVDGWDDRREVFGSSIACAIWTGSPLADAGGVGRRVRL